MTDFSHISPHPMLPPRKVSVSADENAPRIAAPQHKPLGLPSLLMAAWVLFAISVTLLSLWGHMQMGLNNDHLVLMDGVRKLVAGGIPYVDYIDVSPPMIHLLYAPPFIASQQTGIPLYVTLYLMTYAAIAASLAISAAILHYSGASHNTRYIVLGSIALGLLGSSFVHQAFGDRDHLLMVLASAWFVLQSPLARREAIPPGWRMAAAAMAGIGFAIKPYFYVFYAATIAFALLTCSLRDILRQREHHIIWAFGAVYLAIILAYFPQYPFTVLPVGLKTYEAISWSWDSKMHVIKSELFGRYGLTALIASVLLAVTAPRLLDRGIAYIFVLLAATVCSYALNFGWYYTQYPFIAVVPLLTAAIAAKLIAACHRITRRPWKPLSMLIVAGTIAAASYAIYMEPIIGRAKMDMQMQRKYGRTFATFGLHPMMVQKLDAHFSEHPRFLFLTMDLWSVNLLKEGTKRENVGRFDIVWPLPGIVKMQADPAQQQEGKKLLDWFTSSIASDIERHRPDMLINDVSPVKRGLPANFDMLQLLRGDPAFSAAFSGYTLAERMNYCTPNSQSLCAYDVYYRQ